MIKCRAILKDGVVVLGKLTDIYNGSDETCDDATFHIFTANPSPNEIVTVRLAQCRKITIANVKDGHADHQDNDDGQQAD